MQGNLKNCFLIAVPGMVDSNFSRTVVLIAGHETEQGALGIVINRPGAFSLSEACQQLGLDAPTEENDIGFGWGGPVRPRSGFILHADEGQWETTIFRGSGMALTVSSDVLSALARGEGPSKAYPVLGCAAWAAGQLEQEIENGGWMVAASNARIALELALEERYEAALSLVGIENIDMKTVFVSETIGHA